MRPGRGRFLSAVRRIGRTVVWAQAARKIAKRQEAQGGRVPRAQSPGCMIGVFYQKRRTRAKAFSAPMRLSLPGAEFAARSWHWSEAARRRAARRRAAPA